jgi:hypothetical protein
VHFRLQIGLQRAFWGGGSYWQPTPESPVVTDIPNAPAVRVHTPN